MRYFIVLLLLSLPACFVTRSLGDQIQADISRLKDEMASMQREQYETLQQVNHHIKDVKTRTSSLEKNTFKQAAESNLEKENLISEIQQLRGQLEETQHQLNQVQEIKQANLSDSQKDAVQNIPDNKADHFVFAKQLYDNGQYPEAIAALDLFLQRFKDEKQFIGQVYFLRANAYFEQAKHAEKEPVKKELYKKAILSFQEVLTRFPNAAQVPESLFKIGQSLEAMGFSKDAIVFYEEIISKHARSSFVKDAKARLVKLKPSKK